MKPVYTDARGRPWHAYLYEYDWDGSTWGFDIVAPSKEEADARLKRLPLARYVGQRDGEPIPANFASSVYVWAITWLRNLLP
jgi:hypothetical protein